MASHNFNSARLLFNHRSVHENAAIPVSTVDPFKNPELYSSSGLGGVTYVEMFKQLAIAAAKHNTELKEGKAATMRRCGHSCFAGQGPDRCCYCFDGGSATCCSSCIPRTMVGACEKWASRTGARSEWLKEIRNDVNELLQMVGLDGTRVEISASGKQDRDRRLNDNVEILYHQTDEDGGRGVLKTGFQRGKPSCMAGSGIYFAESAKDTEHKAHKKGCMLTVRVRLGRVKTIDRDGDRTITFRSLLREGYDSVMIPRPGGKEYVVYNSDQAEVIQANFSRSSQGGY